MISNDFTPALFLIIIGFILVIFGLLHTTTSINHLDIRSFRLLHNRLRHYSGFYSYIWPLGTVPVTITLILVIFIASWQTGIIVSLVYLLAAILEHVVKRKVDRRRPFELIPDVIMCQPKKPSDPSHPSGDAMRAWFLALIFPFSFALSWPVYALSITIAITLSLGRICMGVHFPLDVIGGAGLGLISSGVALISYQLVIMS